MCVCQSTAFFLVKVANSRAEPKHGNLKEDQLLVHGPSDSRVIIQKKEMARKWRMKYPFICVDQMPEVVHENHAWERKVWECVLFTMEKALSTGSIGLRPRATRERQMHETRLISYIDQDKHMAESAILLTRMGRPEAS